MNYYSVWKSFNKFFVRLDVRPEQWEDRLTLFVGYLIQTKKKSTTIKSYISAIRAVLSDIGVELNENKNLLSSLTRACKLNNDKIRTKIPIQKPLLNAILKKCHKMLTDEGQTYLGSLYRAIFATAYYGLLRVGEVTKGDHPVKARDVHIAVNKKKIQLVLRSSKTHTEGDKPQIITINGISQNGFDEENCPFHILDDFLSRRPTCRDARNEPFFVL